jgi:hypothetical protein
MRSLRASRTGGCETTAGALVHPPQGQPLPGYIGCITPDSGGDEPNPSALKKELAARKRPK